MEIKATVNAICDKAGEAAHAAKDTTKTLAKIAKCKMQILKLQEGIRKNYQKLGKVYYKDFITDEEPDEAEYDPLCRQISESYQRISRLKEMIAELKVGTVDEDEQTEE